MQDIDKVNAANVPAVSAKTENGDITEELCLKAVRKNGIAIQFVPEQFLTKELCIEALKAGLPFKADTKAKTNDSPLFAIPESMIDEDICKEAVKRSYSALKYVPDKYYNKRMYLRAVKHDGMALKFVPEHKRDFDICKAAIRSNIDCVKYIPKTVIRALFEQSDHLVSHKGK